MPSISGRVEVNLTVSDPETSASWYSTLLDLELLYDFTGADRRMRYIALTEAADSACPVPRRSWDNLGEHFSELHTGPGPPGVLGRPTRRSRRVG
jgi:catechol 2,3-dioxygenase-like lactoylglutathione lyase family enzyme